jgi:hypothetical protein
MQPAMPSDPHHGRYAGIPLRDGPGPRRSEPARRMPMVAIESGGPLPALADPLPAAVPHGARAADAARPAGERTVWLDGDVLLCACPECGAPMTVRLWLMVADCWRCETCVELTLEQQHEARRLLERQHEASRSRSTPPRPGPDTPRAKPADQPAVRIEYHPAAPPLAAPAPAARERPAGNWFERFLKDMPAWLVSLVVHVILLTILGLLTEGESDGPYITLSTRVDRAVRDGGDTRIVAPDERAAFDLGVPDTVDWDDPAIRRALARADQDARELRLIEPDQHALPDLEHVKQQITDVHATRRMLAARDPRVRVELVRREGGTTLTEAAVARGLLWLARHQRDDGAWSLDQFHRVHACSCDGRGSLTSDMAATTLALLPFLGAGQTHLTGIYRDHVAKGLRWLIQHQGPDGDLRGGSGQYPGMYAQGQGAIVLCEAFLMTGDEDLRSPAQRAIDFIVAAQYPDGGWRYYPKDQTRNQQGDTSVVGWQLMALQSALAAGLLVPEPTMENAGHFLESVQQHDGARYAYLPREQATPAMTAEALLCRVYLGWKRDHPSLGSGVRWLLETQPPSFERPNIYYWYYATQTMHHFGGPMWDEWNLRMRDVLVATQETRGHEAGSWAPIGPLTSQGGRVYMTALAICCLEVYYRHLPIFRQIDLR